MEKKTATLWICPKCGFGFDEIHTDDNYDAFDDETSGLGYSYSCPACMELKLAGLLQQAVHIVERFQETGSSPHADEWLPEARSLCGLRHIAEIPTIQPQPPEPTIEQMSGLIDNPNFGRNAAEVAADAAGAQE